VIFSNSNLSDTMLKKRFIMTIVRGFQPFALVFVLAFGCPGAIAAEAMQYDLVFTGGRVIDPESGFDQKTNVAISEGKIAAISELPLLGIETIDVSGLIVSPGFIDLHSHALTRLGQRFQAMDGVTTALELEAGVYPIDALTQLLGQKAVINYGASTSHLSIRQLVMERTQKPHLLTPAEPLPLDPNSQIKWSVQPNAAFVQLASEAQRKDIQKHLEQGIAEGGLGIGLLLDYVSEAVNADELDMIFQVAASTGVPVFVHIRRGLPGNSKGLEEVIALARKHRAAVHVCHLNASAMGGIYDFLEIIARARADGVDISTEAYPYNAGSTSISAAVFSRDWQSIFGISHEDIEWAATGERFTQSMWEDYRVRFPEGQIIHHYGNEKWTRATLQADGVIVASDAMPLVTKNDKVHPRGIGTFSRVLGRYIVSSDNPRAMNLVTALAKMTVLPAQRLEDFAPAFGQKGRLREGYDADLTLFDPRLIADAATYQEPLRPSTGIQYVLVNGEFVVKNGRFIENALPGQWIKGVEPGL
jgi:imidazolonepropionase-like amidohydrolase